MEEEGRISGKKLMSHKIWWGRPPKPIRGKEKDVDSGKTELPHISEIQVCVSIWARLFFLFSFWNIISLQNPQKKVTNVIIMPFNKLIILKLRILVMIKDITRFLFEFRPWLCKQTKKSQKVILQKESIMFKYIINTSSGVCSDHFAKNGVLFLQWLSWLDTFKCFIMQHMQRVVVGV